MRPLIYFLTLLAYHISFTISATPPPNTQNLEIEQVRSPPGLPEPSVYTTSQNDTTTLDAGVYITCFDHSTPSTVPFKPIRYMDCYSDMARGPLLGDGVMVHKRWARPDLPFAYNAGTCMLIVDTREGHREA
ncbi:MAG: hypothetical protein Q9218_008387, partial [Villophora microphyllina]